MHMKASVDSWLRAIVILLAFFSCANGRAIAGSAEGFETNDFRSFPWESSGDADWRITRQQRHSGAYSAQSGSIGDAQSTRLRVTLDCVSGHISFCFKVSSESGCDYLRFYIDGAEKNDWSGQKNWTEVSFSVSAGISTFEWVYSKDGSVSEGDDAAWIDDIVFPLEGAAGPGGSLPLTASVEITTWQDNKRAACSFTFDDNMKTHLSHFAPKFRALGFVGTIFLITNDQALRTVRDSYSQYARLVDLGWEIGSHTVNHLDLTTLNDSSLRTELADSRTTLETLFDLPSGLTLAYPFSATDARVRNMVGQYYTAARGGLESTISPRMSQWPLEGYDRFNLPSYAWTGSGHNLNAMNSATNSAISRGEWIVEMIHGTDGDGWDPPDWTSVYEPHFDYVASRATSLWIDTFGNVCRYIVERNACTVSIQPVAEGTAVVLTSSSTLPPTPVPLTIKIDIPDEWISVTVTDGGNILAGRIITENLNKYYLVNAVPTNTTKELRVSGGTRLSEAPFSRGVNISTWFEAPSTQHVNFLEFTKEDFINIKSLGCDVVRLPVRLSNMTGGPPDYAIDPLLFDYLDQVIDWTEDLGLHLILDNHAYGEPTDPGIVDFLVPVWTQIAQHYRNRSNLIYYEVMNEPWNISNNQWNRIQGEVIDAIRAVDQTHAIIVGAANWNAYENLNDLPVYADDNLIYTFHFYRPMLFTHQGTNSAEWPSASLIGIPFPYDAGRMPGRPAELVPGTWAWDRWENYPYEGTVEYIEGLLDMAVDFRRRRDVPLFCGEFGVYINNCDNEDRVFWYGTVRRHLEENGIAWTMWDYKYGFEIFVLGSNKLFDYDLNIPLVEALGLTAPPPMEYVPTPDVEGFDLYRDHVAPGIIAPRSEWITDGLLDYSSEDNPASGFFCIHWTGVNQYHQISFQFVPAKDLSALVDGGFAVDFWIRCNTPSAKIDIRFVDTKTDAPGDRPWRRRYTIDRNVAVWNGQWNHLQIPLSAFREMGAWDDAWYNPIGAFDWKAVDCFDIVPEYGSLTGIHFYIDDIRVIKPE